MTVKICSQRTHWPCYDILTAVTTLTHLVHPQTGTVTQTGLPSMELASHVASGLSPGCSTSDPAPANLPGKAEAGPSVTPTGKVKFSSTMEPTSETSLSLTSGQMGD